MSNLFKDYEVVTVRRDDIAHAVFMFRDDMDESEAFDRAELIPTPVMQSIAGEMMELYFGNNLHVDYNTWIITAWENLNLDTELESPMDTMGSA